MANSEKGPESPMTVERKGVFPKYIVFHHPDFIPDTIYGGAFIVNGQNVKLQEVDSWTFVLRPDRDYHARVALAAYAESVRHWNPDLADDIDGVLGTLYHDTAIEPGAPT